MGGDSRRLSRCDPRCFLIIPALAPFAADVLITLAGQSSNYWAGDYSAAREGAPVGAMLLKAHPLAFLGAAVLYAVGVALLIRYLPAPLSLWGSLGMLIAHTSGFLSWIRISEYYHILEPSHNVLMAGLAAYCYARFFRARLLIDPHKTYPDSK